MDPIKRLTGSLENANVRTGDGAPHYYETSDELEEDLSGTWRPVSRAQDDASNQICELDPELDLISFEEDHPSWDGNDMQSAQDEHNYFQVAIPTFSKGLTTFAYQRALRNRISHDKLLRYAEYDMRKYTPTFIHDCLMLPGSLATLLGKISPSDVLHRMTPALLPGFRAQVDCETRQSCLIQSTDPTDYVQGMLVFGQGKASRDRINRHYRPHARRVKVNVEVDVTISIPPFSRDYVHERWRLQRRKIKAHAWLRSNACSIHPFFCPETSLWNLEDYLAGTYDDDHSLRIEPSVYGLEEDGGISLPHNHHDYTDEPEERVIDRAGCGNLEYEQVEDGWAGW